MHRRIEQNFPISFHFAEQLQKVFLAFFSSGSYNVPYSFLYHVFRRVALLLYCQALMPWVLTKISRPCHVVALGCFLRGDFFLSLVLVGQSTGEKHETMKRRQIHHALRHRTASMQQDPNMFKFVDENQRPSIDICTIRNSPELGTNLAQPTNFCSMMRHLAVEKLSKYFKTPGEGRKNFHKWTSSQHAFAWDTIFV